MFRWLGGLRLFLSLVPMLCSGSPSLLLGETFVEYVVVDWTKLSQVFWLIVRPMRAVLAHVYLGG